MSKMEYVYSTVVLHQLCTNLPLSVLTLFGLLIEKDL